MCVYCVALKKVKNRILGNYRFFLSVYYTTVKGTFHSEVLGLLRTC